MAATRPPCRPAAARVLAAGGTPGSGLSLLQASKALPRKGVGCKNPTKPVPLRRTPAGPADVVVELVTCATCTGAPACPLPQQLDPPQVCRRVLLGLCRFGITSNWLDSTGVSH